MDLAAFPGIAFYFKDEASHITGSLKHRLARSLFLYALCNGRLSEGQGAIDASSGSTAISEAWFARLLGVPFTAVMPDNTAPTKVRLIRSLGAHCELVAPGVDASAVAREHARRENLCYLDQFGLAERATDWRGNNNIAESIFAQMAAEPQPAPTWIVVGAGTGGTSATLGRYVRYRRHATRICLADPENSVFHDYWRSGDATLTLARGSRIEGIGRPRVEPSFNRHVIDHSIRVPDALSFAAARFLEGVLGRKVGPSTGTAFVACAQLIAQMKARRQPGAVVTLLCDGGERYLGTCYDDAWLGAEGLDIKPGMRRLEQFWATGRWPN
jgi:cysteine synthase A